MIPRTFPSIIEALQTKMVVYVLPSITGLTAWIDYIPVKGVTTESNALANTYALDGYQVVKTIESLTGKQAWLDYIPVFESASYNKPWSTDAGGYIPAGGLFSVASLFAAGEQGTWYDPSDLTTLFQDSTGTIPVTAVQQPVGLMLDKSKGLVLGPELVTNGDFATDSDWAKGSGWAIGGGVAAANNALNSSLFKNTFASVANKTYIFTFTISNYVTGALRPSLEGAVGAFVSANGTYTQVITAPSNGARLILTTGGSTTLSIDNISVKELPGNHAFQTTSASRPVLSARYNLLTKTEQFDDAAWPKAAVTVTADAALALDGTNTADKLIATATNANHLLNRTTTFSTTSGQAYTHSLYAKAGEYNFVRLQFQASGFATTAFANFNLATGAVGIVGSTATASISPAGNGWYRCVITVTATGTASSGVQPFVLSTNAAEGAEAFLGDGTSGIFIWGADLRVSNDALGQPAYQRVNTATDYDTVGFKPYLAFDGVDDSLVTNSIDFTATDKVTVFAGVRKLSDAATACLIELSASKNTNTGAFAIFAPAVPTNFDIAWYSKGTTEREAIQNSVTSPVTRVVGGIGDISGDQAILRINGTQAAINTADQGTGNYGNYPLFIGRRNQATLPFNGRLYSLIVRGAASTTAQITSTETYVNQKTGAY